MTLNGNKSDLTEPLSEEPKDENQNRPRNIPHIPGMWIINPANGHAYKWIECKDRIDAQVLAAKENSHLVTITSKEEQIWLEGVFGDGSYWIGLTDTITEGEWQWDTGEPVTYTNWVDYEDDYLQLVNLTPPLFRFFGIKDRRHNERRHNQEERKDYVIMSSGNWGMDIGKWWTADMTGARRVVGPSMAILEKEVN